MGDIELADVYAQEPWPFTYLYMLLKERDLSASISHERMPSYDRHVDFVLSRPYKEWRIVVVDGERVGSCYLTKANADYNLIENCIGVQIAKAHQRQGYGYAAVRMLMAVHPCVSRFYANINQRNAASIALFRKLGFTDWQITLANPGKGHEPHLRSARTGDAAPDYDVQDPKAPHG